MLLCVVKLVLHSYPYRYAPAPLLPYTRAGAANLWSRLGLHGLAGGHWKQGDPRLNKVRHPTVHAARCTGSSSRSYGSGPCPVCTTLPQPRPIR